MFLGEIADGQDSRDGPKRGLAPVLSQAPRKLLHPHTHTCKKPDEITRSTEARCSVEWNMDPLAPPLISSHLIPSRASCGTRPFCSGFGRREGLKIWFFDSIGAFCSLHTNPWTPPLHTPIPPSHAFCLVVGPIPPHRRRSQERTYRDLARDLCME